MAPWLVGSYPARFQIWLAYGATGIALLACAASAFSDPYSGYRENHSRAISGFLGFIGLFAVVVSLQLVVRQHPPLITTEWSQELRALAPTIGATESLPVSAASIAPAVTRFHLARLLLALGTALLGTVLFHGPRQRVWLYGTLATTAATMSIFGMAQRMSWNGQLFGTVPLRFGGQPFGAFVNRNNAAGFLLVGLAAAIGGIAVCWRSTGKEARRTGVVAFCAMAILTTTGIVFSQSRGGALAMICGLLAVGICLRRPNSRLLWSGIAGAIICGSVLIAWLGQGENLQARFSTLRDPASALGVRLQHWSDMCPAVYDRPLLGSGLGTYKYVNRPYQRRLASGWFWNADNEYFEILVETGIAGLAVAICGLGALAWALIQLRLEDQHRDLFLTGLFLMTALGLQSATDFGVTLLAVGIPALLLGSLVASAAASGRQVTPADPTGESESLRFRLLFPVALVVGAAAWEIRTAGASLAYREHLPPSLSRYDAIPAESVDAEIAEGLRLLQTTPEDGELHAVVAQLHVRRFQLVEAESLAATQVKLSPETAWNLVSIANLHRVSQLLPKSDLPALRAEANIATNLVVARNHFLKAVQSCDWLPDVHRQLAILSFLSPRVTSRDSYSLLLRSALLDAADPNRLLLNSQIAFQDNFDSIGELCCRRSLVVMPMSWKAVIRLLRTNMDDESIVRVLQDFPEFLVDFARIATDPSAVSGSVVKLNNLSNSALANRPRGWEHWLRSQAADLSGDRDVAIAELHTAVAENPNRIEWLLQLADWLIAGEDFVAAERLLKSANVQGAHELEIQKRLRSAIQGRLRQLGPSDETP
ncbi:MAG: O-antigen ligase family protein [Planctomycetaceae bacterium]